jgi:hypothetical protein
LQKFLDEVILKSYFVYDDWTEPPERWLLKPFHIGAYKESLADGADYLIGRCRLLEEKVKAIKAFKE